MDVLLDQPACFAHYVLALHAQPVVGATRLFCNSPNSRFPAFNSAGYQFIVHCGPRRLPDNKRRLLDRRRHGASCAARGP